MAKKLKVYWVDYGGPKMAAAPNARTFGKMFPHRVAKCYIHEMDDEDSIQLALSNPDEMFAARNGLIKRLGEKIQWESYGKIRMYF